jgi:tetratricopeptide (TPR) repeat protein
MRLLSTWLNFLSGTMNRKLDPRLPCFALVFLILLFPASASSQTRYFFYNDPKADVIIRRGLTESYNLEYAVANKDWDELIHLYPEHPAGFVYKAALMWWQATEDRENKSLEIQFDLLTRTAIEKAAAWLQRNPQDKIVLAYLASAYGNVTRFDVTVTHSYLSALRNGKKAHKYIVQAHSIDGNFYDAYIGLGSYNYFTGALPGVIKPFAWLLGARGEKNEGIRQLLLAKEKGEYAQTEAKIVLLSVYVTEKRWSDYERLLVDLMREYPLNHVFYMWASNQYVGSKRWDEGIAVLQSIKKLVQSSQSEYKAVAMAWLDYSLARNYFAKQDWNKALDSLRSAELNSSRHPVLLAQLYLLKGNTLDMLERREEAVAAYNKSLQYLSIEDSAAKAKRCLRSPFRQ